MTKIDQINESVVMQTSKKPTMPTQVPFSASLENALSRQIQNSADANRTSALGEPQSSIIGRPEAFPGDVIGRTDRLLGLLESYAAGLENPGATLKELASIVTLMKDEATELMASANPDGAEKNDINGIAAKAALTANVEYIKFQRGDYI